MNTCAGERFYIHELPPLTWRGMSRELEVAMNPNVYGRHIPCPVSRPCLSDDGAGEAKPSYHDARSNLNLPCDTRCLNVSAAAARRGPEGQHENILDMGALRKGLGEPPWRSFWRTDQYQLEHLLFHRIARDCQVEEPERATLFLVPYPSGMFMEASSRNWGTGLVTHAATKSYLSRVKQYYLCSVKD